MFTTEIPAGLTVSTHTNGTKILTCDDCRCTTPGDDLATMRLRHKKSCDTKDLQVLVTFVKPAAVEAAPTAARPVGADFVRNCKAGESGTYDERDIRLAVACGSITVSDAMNSDF